MEKPASTNPTENNQRRKKKPAANKKSFVIAIIVIVLGIALFTGYQLLSKKYSAEAVQDQFTSALVAKDKASLKELIQPDDERMKINDKSMDALFALIDSEPSILQEITEGLEDTFYDGIFSLQKDGKHYGIFDRYVIRAKGYFLLLSDTAENKTTFYLNDTEIGKLDGTEEYREVGPYLAGSYLVKAVNDTKGEQGEDMTTVKLAGPETKVEVALDTAPVTLDEDEMIRAVSASNNDYIIPESDYIYLTKGDLYHLTASELRIARNEIFARYGYIFESKQLQNYFNNMDWYSPNPYYTGSLSDVETHNVELIKSME